MDIASFERRLRLLRGMAWTGAVLLLMTITLSATMRLALAARHQTAAELAARIASLRPSHSAFDADALYAANLIDGVIDANHAA